MTTLLVGAAVVMGLSVPFQAGFSGALKLGSPLNTAGISLAIGAAAVLLVALVGGQGWDLSGLARNPWWAWCGGLMGAVYVSGLIIVTPRLGAAATLAISIAAQLVAAVLFDHFGLLRFPVQSLSWPRVAGVGLVVVGAVLVQLF